MVPVVPVYIYYNIQTRILFEATIHYHSTYLRHHKTMLTSA